MTEAILFLLGALAAAVLFLHGRRPSSSDDLASDTDEFNQMDGLPSGHLHLGDLAARILAADDWESVGSVDSSLQRAFLKERKSLALSCLRRVRMQTRVAYDDFLASSRLNRGMSPVGELRMAAGYFHFLLLWLTVKQLIVLLGPFRAGRAFESLVNAAASLCLTLANAASRTTPVLARGK